MDERLRDLLKAAYETGRSHGGFDGFDAWLNSVDTGDLISAAAGVPVPTERIPLRPFALIPFVEYDNTPVDYAVQSVTRSLNGPTEVVLIPRALLEATTHRD